MPPVGGFVALCVHGKNYVEHKTHIQADFHKIEITPDCDSIRGNLMIIFTAYRIHHGGLRVVLVGHLGLPSISTSKNIFKHCRTEVLVLPGGDLTHGHKRLKFNLTIPPSRSYPPPFINSNGSLTYRIFAFIKRDGEWEEIGKKLVNFKGYYNVLHMELKPFEEHKVMQIKAGEVVSTFTVPNTTAIIGQCDGLEGILELQGAGVLDSQVNATLTFFRNIKYGENIHTEVILSQNRRAEIRQNFALFHWTIAVPMMKRISYSDELIPQYFVRYYLKYEVFLESGSEEQHAAVNGVVEIEIGTSRNPSGQNSNDNASGATNQTSEIGKRKSVMSLVSMLSLPPAYSQLHSRSGSMMSLETLPPQYDELNKQ